MDHSEQLSFAPTFGSGFLDQHAGRIISDVHFAVVELVANAWDAGADEVHINWPPEPDQRVEVSDDGSGMTAEEFRHRWNELSYNRLEHQGALAAFPPGREGRRRVAFGRNGLGRHAMFFFADSYVVETAKAGTVSVFEVRRTSGRAPYRVTLKSSHAVDWHGTKLHTLTSQHLPSADEIVELIGSRFVADPEFRIYVNGQEVTLVDLVHLTEVETVAVPGVGDFTVRRIDSQVTGRTSKQNGVAWWVNQRLVGTPTWDVEDGALLDARSRTGRRFVYIIEANPLANHVAADWSHFLPHPEVARARQAVADHVREDLRHLTADVRRDRKVQALRANQRQLRDLPPASREQIAHFADELQLRSPTISARDLENAVRLMAQLEASRTGYALLAKLAALRPGELDRLDDILEEWSVEDIKEILTELRYRLRLIRELENLVERRTTDELHDLQPLFEHGLWIFGPAFESIAFTSNRTLATVVRTFLGDAVLMKPRFRPDFVILPESSIGIYSTDAFDDDNEVAGLDKVVVVELKRGGFKVTNDEKDQALGYCRELRRAGRVSRSTQITAYVLGTTIDPNADEEATEGNTRIIPRRYSDVLRQAHARTFHLLNAVKGSGLEATRDPDLEEALGGVQEEIDIPEERESA